MSKATGSSDSQNAILETTENIGTQGNGGKKVALYSLDKAWSQRLHTFTFRNGLINSFEMFRLCKGSLAICAQAHR